MAQLLSEYLDPENPKHLDVYFTHSYAHRFPPEFIDEMDSHSVCVDQMWEAKFMCKMALCWFHANCPEFREMRSMLKESEDGQK